MFLGREESVPQTLCGRTPQTKSPVPDGVNGVNRVCFANFSTNGWVWCRDSLWRFTVVISPELVLSSNSIPQTRMWRADRSYSPEKTQQTQSSSARRSEGKKLVATLQENSRFFGRLVWICTAPPSKHSSTCSSNALKESTGILYSFWKLFSILHVSVWVVFKSYCVHLKICDDTKWINWFFSGHLFVSKMIKFEIFF